MNWRIAGTVLAKELTETLRDRRTLFIMIVVPTFLYPALFVVMEQLALFGQRSLEGTAVRVAVVGGTRGSEPELVVSPATGPVGRGARGRASR